MDNEKMLIKKCKNGDIDSFELLIQEYEKKVYNIALRILGNRDDALDAAQEVFIRIYKSIPNFKQQSSFSTWIYRIATNVCFDELRRRKKAKIVSMDSKIIFDDNELEMQIKDDILSLDQIIEKKELKAEVNKAIQSLSNNHKTVIVLRDINGFSYEEIAKILKCSLGTVKSRINRARICLKNILLKQREQIDETGV